MGIEHKLIDVQDAGGIPNRLEQISRLKPGWYYGEGDSFDTQQLSSFLQEYNLSYSRNLPTPYVYPSVNGNIQLEWTNEEVDISLTINPETLEGSYHLLIFSDEGEQIRELNLRQENDWVQLNTWLTEHLI